MNFIKLTLQCSRLMLLDLVEISQFNCFDVLQFSYYDVPVNLKNMNTLSQNKRVKWIEIQNCKITQGLDQIFPNVTSLKLSNLTRDTPFQNFFHLTSLTLFSQKIPTACLQTLPLNLKVLKITTASPLILKSLALQTELEVFKCNASILNDLTHLSTLKTIVTYSHPNQFKDSFLTLQQNPHLEKISISCISSQIMEEPFFKYLSSISHQLKCLSLPFMPHEGNSFHQFLSQCNLDKLRTINISVNSEEELEFLRKFPLLEKIFLTLEGKHYNSLINKIYFCGDGILQIPRINLKKLSLSFKNNSTTQIFEELSQCELPNLMVLNLNPLPSRTVHLPVGFGKFLKAIASPQFVSLKYFEIDCPRSTEWASLQSATKLKGLRLWNFRDDARAFYSYLGVQFPDNLGSKELMEALYYDNSLNVPFCNLIFFNQ
jgi:hypothetical protein